MNTKRNIISIVIIAIIFTACNNSSYDQNYPTTKIKTSIENSVVINTKTDTRFSKQKGKFIDIRDNKSYRWVKIGNQIWMADNFAYNNMDNGSWVYNNDKTFSGVFGYLYDWKTAIELAPKGWHLPTDQEWEQMISYLKENTYSYDGIKGSNNIAKSMIQPLLWFESDVEGSVGNKDYSEKINTSGFSALAGGYRNNNGEYKRAGVYGYWWSATEGDEIGAYCRSIYYKGKTIERGDFYTNDKTSGYSVRYVKN